MTFIKTFKSLCMIIRVDDVTYIKMQFAHSKLCNFISSWEIIKRYQETMLKVLSGMKSLILKLKLCNFITSWKLIKTPQNFVRVLSCLKLIKICHKTGMKFWSQFPYKSVLCIRCRLYIFYQVCVWAAPLTFINKLCRAQT